MGQGPSVRVPKMEYIDVFTNQNVLRCLGFNPRELEGSYEALDRALGEGGVLRKNAGVLSALVRGGLPAGYVLSQLDGNVPLEDFETADSPSNLILVQYDLRKGAKTSLRGLALCQVRYNGEIVRSATVLPARMDVSKVTMELLVLGNAAGRARGSLRNEIFQEGGGNIIRLVQYIGKNLPQGISLYGLETVITLYWKFGWRFLPACGVAERGKYKEAQDNLLTFFSEFGPPEIEGVTRSEEGQNAYDAKLRTLLAPFQTYSKEYYKTMATEGKAAAEEHGRDNGYHMILCQDKNPYSGVSGGGRRKRKRTRKRALRKRHRRTRHKKKRRKTQKRKRRRKTRKRRR